MRGLSSARWDARHRGAPLHRYAEVLHERQIKYRWRYAQHWLPHDVKHREMNTAMSRIERCALWEVSRKRSRPRLDSVNAVRRMLDRAWIDPGRCERSLDCLNNYRYKMDGHAADLDKLPIARLGLARLRCVERTALGKDSGLRSRRNAKSPTKAGIHRK